MRRALLVMVTATALVSVPACSKSSREGARSQFVDQLAAEGGLSPELAQCIADRFFLTRSDEDLKAFFARKELTAEESAEFQRLGKACLDDVGTAVPAATT